MNNLSVIVYSVDKQCSDIVNPIIIDFSYRAVRR